MSERKPFRKFKNNSPSLTVEQKIEQFILRNSRNGFFTKVSTINYKFEIIPEIECDWGSHMVIQCPKCEELFSIDKKCPAFQSIELLLKQNTGLFSNKDQSSYFAGCHSC